MCLSLRLWCAVFVIDGLVFLLEGWCDTDFDCLWVCGLLVLFCVLWVFCFVFGVMVFFLCGLDLLICVWVAIEFSGLFLGSASTFGFLI